MADYRAPLDDIRFVLAHVADLAGLAELEAFSHADPESVFGVIEEYGRFMSDVVAPTNQIGDTQGSVRHDDGTVTTPDGFKEAYAQYVAAGWGAVPFEPGYGGGGFPWLVGIVLQEMLNSANMAFAMAPLLTQGALDLLSTHGDEAQKEIFLAKMITGEWAGSMNLTEPDAGSDVGALRTRAVRQDDGTYRITGTKIFISFGEHDLSENIVHLVLARTPDAPPGTKGISCFIVPKFLVEDDGSLGARNDVTCVSIEHKMGIKASPTCVLSYGEGAHGDGQGAVGYLIGDENAGMRYMFTMMNNARLSVGVEGLGLAEVATQRALAFAHERRQGRAVGAPAGTASPIVEHPDVRRMLLTMKAYTEAMRALVYLNAAHIDLAGEHPDTEERRRSAELVDLLTPVSKAWCTDLGVEVTSLGIQVHGGMGYVEETGAAQHYRDARIAPIYEGTNGIQAMDLVGRKLPMRGGGVVKDFLAGLGATVEELAGAGDDLAPVHRHLDEAVRTLSEATDWVFANGADDPNQALAAATPYLRLFGAVTGGWLLARSALAAQRLLDANDGGSAGHSAEFLADKIVTARFYAEHLLPQAQGLLSPITAGAADLLTARL
ncbi:acyl-CoA dehydrogenase [soil metagenome]